MSFTANAGSGGATFGSDAENAGAEQWPIAKMTWGAAGAGQRVTLAAGLPVQPGTSTVWTVSQALGTAATRFFAQISDGTNSPAIKAASTAAVAADPALVVAISPNNGVAITGTGGLAATKASGTAAATTDIAQVVSLSPNSPIVLPTPSSNLLSSAATTNPTSVKGSSGKVFSVTASNTGGAVAYVKLYNKATAPTVGTDVPVITIPVPAGGSVNLPFGTPGAIFGTGIGLGITNLAADTDTTAVAAAQVKVITAYI